MADIPYMEIPAFELTLQQPKQDQRRFLFGMQRVLFVAYIILIKNTLSRPCLAGATGRGWNRYSPYLRDVHSPLNAASEYATIVDISYRIWIHTDSRDRNIPALAFNNRGS